jgi:hypothetical protein
MRFLPTCRLSMIGEYQKSLEKHPNFKAANRTEFGR